MKRVPSSLRRKGKQHRRNPFYKKGPEKPQKLRGRRGVPYVSVFGQKRNLKHGLLPERIEATHVQGLRDPKGLPKVSLLQWRSPKDILFALEQGYTIDELRQIFRGNDF